MAPPPVEKKEDNLEDSEVLKMLRNSNLSEEPSGLRRTGQGRKISMGSDLNNEGKILNYPQSSSIKTVTQVAKA